MLAFDVSVNEKRVCVAGTESSQVLSIGVTWVRESQHRPERISSNVGGLVAGDNHKHFGWTMPPLSIGDTVTIRLIEVNSADDPEHVYEPASKAPHPVPLPKGEGV